MSQPPRKRKSGTSRLGRILAWSAAGLFVFLVVAFIGLRIWFNAYLASEGFQRRLSALTARHLKAEGRYLPLRFEGTNVFSDGFDARGGNAAEFSAIEAEQIRASFNPRGLLNRVWRIDGLSAHRLKIDLDGPRVALPAVAPSEQRAEPAGAAKKPAGSSWLPNRIDLREATIEQFDLSWGGEGTGRKPGALTGTRISIRPAGSGVTSAGTSWLVAADGGTLRFGDGEYPPLMLGQARLRYDEGALYVTEAALADSDGGAVAVTGEVKPEESLRLDVAMKNVSITPYLPEDWRAKLSGRADATATISTSMPIDESLGEPIVEGKVELREGLLEALPILNRIAAFTQTDQFRRIAITDAKADFKSSGGIFEGRNVVLESSGLVRLEGDFIVRNGEIDGRFMVGVAPRTLQWLPGSRERVFNEDRGGYVWTPMRLTGPVDSMNEDLSKRLIAAAKDEVLEGLPKKAKDAAGEILDFISPFLK